MADGVLVLIPAYNEAGSISRVVTAVREAGYDCLVVDDGSTDDTAALAEAAGATVSSDRRHLGLGRTMRRGYQAALRRDADIVVQMDADGQHDAADIAALVAPVATGRADMVLGSRFGGSLRYPMPRLKRWGNRAFSWVLRRLTRADIQDGQTGFRAMHRDVLAECLPINEFSYTQEMIIRTAREGFRITSIPITLHAREHGESRLFRSPWSFALRGWWIIIRTVRDHAPFKFFFWPGAAITATSLVPLLSAIVYYLDRGYISGRIGSLVGGSALLILGIQLMLVGLLADMIRTHTRY